MSRIYAQHPDFGWVPKTEVAKSRPALERAGYRCEGCRLDEGLRVAEGSGQLVVLCPRCGLDDGFNRVLAYRKAAAQTNGMAR